MILLPAQKRNSLLILNYRVRSKSFLPPRHAEKGLFSRSVHTLDRSIESNYRFPQSFHFPPNRLFFSVARAQSHTGTKAKALCSRRAGLGTDFEWNWLWSRSQVLAVRRRHCTSVDFWGAFIRCRSPCNPTIFYIPPDKLWQRGQRPRLDLTTLSHNVVAVQWRLRRCHIVSFVH